MKNFKKQYRDLEMSILSELRDRINKSNYYSKHNNQKAIKVNVFDYVELVIVNDSLVFLDSKGYQCSLFVDVNLEDLIDLL